MLPLAEPGLWSPNRACRLVQTADGWIAINLAREEDRELVPAWLCTDMTGDPWDAIVELARACQTKPLIDQAILLGMPAARVGEVREMKLDPPALPLGRSGPARGGTAAARGRPLGALGRTTLRRGLGRHGGRRGEGREPAPARPNARDIARLLPSPQWSEGRAGAGPGLARRPGQTARRGRGGRRADHQRAAARAGVAWPGGRRRRSRPIPASPGSPSPAMAGRVTRPCEWRSATTPLRLEAWSAGRRPESHTFSATPFRTPSPDSPPPRERLQP